MEDDRFKRVNNWLSLGAVLAGLVASAFGLVNQHTTAELSRDVAKLDQQLKQAEEARKQSEFELKFRRDIYDEVKALLRDKEANKGKVTVPTASLVLTLVNTLPQQRPDQQMFHASVMKIVSGMMPQEDSVEAAQLRREIRDATQTSTLDARTEPPREFFQAVQTAVLSEKGWDVDIFYCTGVGAEARNVATARQAFDHLTKLRSDLGRLRLRKLPAEINRLPQYRGEGFIIRADDDEEARARKLVAELAGGGVGGFAVTANAGGRSVWYLSAFVCASP